MYIRLTPGEDNASFDLARFNGVWGEVGDRRNDLDEALEGRLMHRHRSRLIEYSRPVWRAQVRRQASQVRRIPGKVKLAVTIRCDVSEGTKNDRGGRDSRGDARGAQPQEMLHTVKPGVFGFKPSRLIYGEATIPESIHDVIVSLAPSVPRDLKVNCHVGVVLFHSVHVRSY